MNLDFTKEQNMLRKSVAEFLSKECPFDHVKELEESIEGYSPEIWKKMAELGWMEGYFPEQYGGYGDPFMDMVIIMEELGKSAMPSPFFSTVILCGQAILAGGSEAQKKDILPEIAGGNVIMTLAQYEADASYLPSGIRMPAVQAEDQYILNGIKMFVPDANIADRIIVAANLENNGITLFLVDAKAPGITCTKMPTISKDNTCEVVFKDVTVPAESMIGKPGDGWAILENISPKAVAAKSAEMLGGCHAAISMTTAYAKERQQYGKPIGGFQAIQHYMADMLLGYDTGINYLYKTAWMIDEGMDVSLQTSVLKAHVNEQYKFITGKGVHIHGGIGTTREFNIGLFYRRAKSSEYILGDTDYHHERIVQRLSM